MSNLGFIFSHAPSFAAVFELEPHVEINFSELQPELLPAVLLALINHGVSTEAEIHAYLQQRGCPYNRAIIRYFLELYSGLSSAKCLWWLDPDDRYFAWDENYSQNGFLSDQIAA